MSRADLFKQALAEDQAAKARKKGGGGFSQDETREPILWVPLTADVPKPVRVWGAPSQKREDNADPIIFKSSQILGDDGNKFRCIWSDDSKWILWKIYKAVMPYDYDEVSKVRTYKLAKDFPTLVTRISCNNDPGNTFESGWYPKSNALIHVLDRTDMERHRREKSWGILSKNEAISKTDPSKKFYEFGISRTVYDLILNTVVEENGDWLDYDLLVERFSKEKTNNWYAVKSFYDKKKLTEDQLAIMTELPLTEEELSWKKFDLTNLAKPTSYTKILNRLGGFILQVDSCLGKSFHPELVELSNQEKEVWEKERLTREKDAAPVHVVPKSVPSDEITPSSPSPVISRTRATSVVQSEPNNDFWRDAEEAGWKGIEKMTEADRKLVKSIDVKNEDIVYLDLDGKIDRSNIVPCTTCKKANGEEFMTSFNIPVCPKCGQVFS